MAVTVQGPNSWKGQTIEFYVPGLWDRPPPGDLVSNWGAAVESVAANDAGAVTFTTPSPGSAQRRVACSTTAAFDPVVFFIA